MNNNARIITNKKYLPKMILSQNLTIILDNLDDEEFLQNYQKQNNFNISKSSLIHLRRIKKYTELEKEKYEEYEEQIPIEYSEEIIEKTIRKKSSGFIKQFETSKEKLPSKFDVLNLNYILGNLENEKIISVYENKRKFTITKTDYIYLRRLKKLRDSQLKSFDLEKFQNISEYDKANKFLDEFMLNSNYIFDSRFEVLIYVTIRNRDTFLVEQKFATLYFDTLEDLQNIENLVRKYYNKSNVDVIDILILNMYENPVYYSDRLTQIEGIN